MNIIIVGCGKVGIKLATQLSREGDMVTMIDTRYDILHHFTDRSDVRGIVGNGATVETLKEADIDEADLLIAVTGSDELNLLCCLVAKKLAGCYTISRVRNPEYAKQLNLIKEELGLAMVINPEQTAATEIARTLRFPEAINVSTFAKGRVELLQFRVEENSVLCDLPINQIQRKLGSDVLVCAVERKDEVFIPNGDFIIREKDLVSVAGSHQSTSEFFKIIGIIRKKEINNVMIAGGGDIAYYLASALLQDSIKVKIIEIDPVRCEKLSLLLPKADVICGDVVDRSVLLEEGIAQADAFIAVTDLDEENILLSLFSKNKSDPKRVVKVNRIEFDEVISDLDLGTVIYPKNLSADYIIRFVRAMKNSIGSNVRTVHSIVDDKAEALEFVIKRDCPLIGIPLEKMKLKKNLLLAVINRGGKIINPRGSDFMQAGDTVIIVTTIEGLTDISDIVEK